MGTPRTIEARLAWSEVATRRDLDALGVALRSEIATSASGVRVEMAELRVEIRGQTRSLFLSLAGLQMTAAALAVGRLL